MHVGDPAEPTYLSAPPTNTYQTPDPRQRRHWAPRKIVALGRFNLVAVPHCCVLHSRETVVADRTTKAHPVPEPTSRLLVHFHFSYHNNLCSSCLPNHVRRDGEYKSLCDSPMAQHNCATRRSWFCPSTLPVGVARSAPDPHQPSEAIHQVHPHTWCSRRWKKMEIRALGRDKIPLCYECMAHRQGGVGKGKMPFRYG